MATTFTARSYAESFGVDLGAVLALVPGVDADQPLTWEQEAVILPGLEAIVNPTGAAYNGSLAWEYEK